MNIFELLKQIKRGCWYKIPVDVYGTAYTAKEGYEASKDLTHFRNHWASKEISTTFEISDPITIPVWDPHLLKNVERSISTITMRNSEIDKFDAK